MFIEITDYVYGKIFVNAHRVVSCGYTQGYAIVVLAGRHTYVIQAGSALSCWEKIKEIHALIATVGAETGTVELTRHSKHKVAVDMSKITSFHDTRLGGSGIIVDGEVYEIEESTSEILALLEAARNKPMPG